MHLRSVGLVLCCVLASCAGASRNATSPPFTAGGRCDGPEYRRLDFWLGEWDVKSPSGKVEGWNVLEKTQDGCAVVERWSDAGGGTGESLFFYDRAARKWKQVWVTSEGAWKEKTEDAASPGTVRFAGHVPRPGGGFALDRTTLKANGARVEQVIEQSIDGGHSWRSWIGVYTRRPAPASCTSPEAGLLDFWVGDWDLVVRARKGPDSNDWAEARGTNHVTKTSNGCVVEESFRADGPGEPWAGRSFSAYAKGEWRQTWVDDQGSYLAFVGAKSGGNVVFTGEPMVRENQRVQMRMVFTNIERDRLLWRWERTVDDGRTWTSAMTIDYRRRVAREPSSAK